MSDKETVKVRVYEEDRPRINELKRGNDAQQDVIHRLLENRDTPAPKAHVEPNIDIPPEVLAEALSESLEDTGADLPAEVREQLDRIESAATTAEERTGELQNTLEGMQR